jgi:nitrite reductase (NADH) small subunit/3-phenylpropionate/trans-cinnamate dioxygenase ferredoxin subunit
MSEFVTVAKVGDIEDGTGQAYNVGGKMVAVFNCGGEHHAINDFCPHMGASLAGGYVEGETVTCPWHAWRFSVKDGTWLDNPKVSTDSYEVRVEGDEIQVRVVKPEEDTTTSEEKTTEAPSHGDKE